MADVELGIDSTRAKQGADLFVKSASAISKAALKTAQDLKALLETMTLLRSAGNFTFKVNSDNIKKVQDAVHQTEGATRRLKTVEDELAKDRERAARQQSRIDGQRLKEIQRLESELGRERARAAAAQSKYDGERLRSMERQEALAKKLLAAEQANRARLLQVDATRSNREQTRRDAETYRNLERDRRTALAETARAQRTADREAARQRRQDLTEEQRLQAQLERDRLRAIRERGRAEARALSERQNLESAVTNLRIRGAPDTGSRAALQLARDQQILNQAVERGILSGRQAAVIRNQLSEAYRREQIAVNSLRGHMTALGSSFTHLSRSAAFAIPGLLTIEDTLFAISEVVTGGSGGFVGGAITAGLVGGVTALATAFAAFKTVEGIAQATIDFQKIRGAIRSVSGSTEEAEKEFQVLSTISNELGIDLRFSALEYAKLAAAAKASNYSIEQTRAVFLATANASAALRLRTDETAGVLYALQQVISQGTLKSEELKRQLGDRLPGAMALAAASMKLTVDELLQRLEEGTVKSKEFIPAFTNALIKLFGAEAKEASTELLAQLQRLRNEIFLLQVEAGKTGIIDALTEGVEGLREALTDPGVREGILLITEGLGTTMKYIVDNAATLTKVLSTVGGAAAGGLAFGPIGAAVGGFAGLAGSTYGTNALKGNETQLAELGDQIRSLERQYDMFSKEGQPDVALQGLADKIRELRVEYHVLDVALHEISQSQSDYDKVVQQSLAATDEQAKTQEEINKAFEAQIAGWDKVKEAQEEFIKNKKILDTGLELGSINQARYNQLLAIQQETLDKATGAYEENRKAIDDAKKAAEDLAKAREKETEARNAASVELIQYTSGLEQSVILAKEDLEAAQKGEKAVEALARSRAINEAAIEATRLALERNQPVSQEELNVIRDKAAELYDLNTQIEKVGKAQQEANKREEEAAKQRSELLLEPWKNAIDGIQDSFVNLFEAVFDNGEDTFKDLSEVIKKTFIKLMAELATIMVLKPALGSILRSVGLGQYATQLGGTLSSGNGLSGLGSLLGSAPSFANVIGGSSSTAAFTGATGEIAASASQAADSLGTLASSGAEATGLFAKLGASLGSAGSVGLLAGLGVLTLKETFERGFGTKEDSIATGVKAGLLATGPFGMWAIPFVDLFLGGSKPSKLQAQGYTSSTNLGFENNAGVKGPFGYVGLFDQGTKGTTKEFDQGLTQALLDIDKTISTVLTREQRTSVTSYLDGRVAPIHKLTNPSVLTQFVTLDRVQQILNGLPEFDNRGSFRSDLIGGFSSDAGNRGLSGAEAGTYVVEAVTNFLNNRNQVKENIADYRLELNDASPAKKQLMEIDESFADLVDTMKDLYFMTDELDEVEQLRLKSIQKLKDEFNASVEEELGAYGNEAAVRRAQLIKENETRLQTAKDLGVDLAPTERLNAISLRTFDRQNRETINNALSGLQESNSPISSGANALRKWNEEVKDAIEVMKRAGATQSDLNQIVKEWSDGVLELRKGFEEGIETAILRIEDPLAASLAEAEKTYLERLASAEAFGVDINRIEYLYGLERAKIIEDFNASAVGSFKNAKDQIKALLDELLAGSSSPLSASEVLKNAQALFAETVFTAFQGTGTAQAEALANLPDVSTTLLDAADAMYASSEDFFRFFNAVINTLKQADTVQSKIDDTPGFATGGSFTVPGNAGPDVRMVRFRASSGERVSIDRKSDQQVLSRTLQALGQETVRGTNDNNALMEKLIHEVKRLNSKLTVSR